MMAKLWSRSKDVVWDEVAGEAVLVRPSSRRTWVLNSTASFVWRRCDGRVTIDQIARALAAATGAEFRSIKEDVLAFCAELEGACLLSPAPASVPTSALAGKGGAFSVPYIPPLIRLKSLSARPRGRPSPRGISGPG
jgi:hypothetical protein